MKKVIYLYMCTILVCFLFSSIYIYLETCYSDKTFDQRPMVEKQLYVKYCADDFSFDPYDSYTSKLELYLIYLCLLVGMWNFADLLLIIEKDNISKIKPEDHLMWNVLNSSTYKSIVRKLKKRKSNGKSKRK